MADQQGGGISWTEQTWNPLRGCSRVSEGCRHCYAEVVAARFSGPGQAYEGLARHTSAGPRWTGKVVLVEEHLNDPLRWQRPRRIFVNSMSDVFHEAVADATIGRLFSVMASAHRHQYQVLTKRVARMAEWFRSSTEAAEIFPARLAPPHIWMGISVEDQKTADERIPLLLTVPAAVRWLSIEPQIGPVHLEPAWLANLHWVVIGGESGAGARPFDLDWARQLVLQCNRAGVAVFVKQLGVVPMITEASWRKRPIGLLNAMTRHLIPPGFVGPKYTGKAADPEEWPPELRRREYPMGAP